jgi:periplasmic copper chaperone A
MSPMRWIPFLFAAALAGCAPDAGAPEPAAEAPVTAPATSGPAVTDAWVRQVPPTARMTAGYFRIHNPGPEPLVIVGVESPLFGLIELHGTFTEDGVARMRQQDTVTVPPGESVSFEPGGLHLMLMQPANGIPSSGTMELTLLLQDGSRLAFNAPISQPRN